MYPDLTPDWEDAPEWANWLAMDKDGIWYWYENQPEKAKTNTAFEDPKNGRSTVAEIASWEESLHQRPKP